MFNMRNLAFFCLFFSIAIFGYPNYKPQKDSLEQLISTLDGKVRLDAYRQLHQIYFDELSGIASLDSFLLLSHAYEAEAQKQNDTKLQASIRVRDIIALGKCYQFDKLRQRAPETLDFLRENQCIQELYVVYKQLILSYCRQGKYDEALSELEKTYQQVQSNKDKLGLFHVQYLTGVVYMHQDRLDKAEENYRQSIKTAKSITPQPQNLISVYAELCNMLQATDRFDDFFKLAKETEAILRKTETQNKGKTYHTDWANLFILYAYAYNSMGDFDHAERYCNHADSISKGDPVISGSIIYIRAHIYEARGAYEKALEQIDKAIAIDPTYLYAKFTKVRILSQIENAPRTWNELEQTIEYADSTRNASFNAKLDELHTRYETDRHIADKERNRDYFLFALGGCILLVLVLGIWIYYSRQILKKNRGLYKQIKEQDRLSQRLDLVVDEYNRLAQSGITTSIEKSSKLTKEGLPGSMQQQQLVARLNTYILTDRNYAKTTIDRNELAYSLSTNRTSLSEAVRKVTGKTLMEYIRDIQLEEAKRMLEDNPELTIVAVAEDCGFNTSRTFHRLFREQYNISPAEYRKVAR